MAIKVIDFVSHIPDDAGYAFGPCVRNDLAGAPHSDNIDFVIDSKSGQAGLISALKSNGYVVNKDKSFRANTYCRSQFTIDKGGKRATLNVYSPNLDNGNFSTDDVIAARYSSDSNRVWMDSSGYIDVIEGASYTIEDVTEEIEDGVYKVCDDGFSESEADELQQAGFSQIAKRPQRKRAKALPVEPEGKMAPEKINTQLHDTNSKPQIKEIAKMGIKENGFFNMVKADAENAAYRVAATQITNGTKGAILAIMEKQGQGSERIKTVSEMLDTEVGSAVVSLIVGMGLTYAPKISEDARVKRLAGEFRVNGLAVAGNAVMETAMEYFLPVIMNALQALPAVDETADIKARVTNPPENAREEEESEEKVKAITPKKAHA